MPTPVGNLHLIADENILLAAGFKNIADLQSRLSHEDSQKTYRSIAKINMISDLIADYFAGDLSALNGIKVRQPGEKFSQNVWKMMRRIPAGKTLSYAELARQAGSPAAIRAAGTACGNNLIAPIIPCHRIIKTGGTLGNYGYGVEIKQWLLRHEGAL